MENLESHRILEFLFYRPGKSCILIVSPGKSWKVKVMFGKLVTADVQARTTQDRVKSTNSMHFAEQRIMCLLNLVRSKNSLKSKGVFKIFQ